MSTDPTRAVLAALNRELRVWQGLLAGARRCRHPTEAYEHKVRNLLAEREGLLAAKAFNGEARQREAAQARRRMPAGR